MPAALLRYPRHKRRAVAQQWQRLSCEAKARLRMERGPKLETLIWRAKHDSRGELLRHGVTYSAAHPDGQTWTVVRSKLGRTNQVDVHLGSACVSTCGLRTVERAMARAKL